METIISAVAQGSIWAVMALGIFISFRVLNRPDMTTEGSFTLGAALGAQALHFDIHPVLVIFISFLGGMAAGAITGLLVTKLRINSLLAGILTMTGLYSINLKIMTRANLSLNDQYTLKTMLADLNLPRNVDTILIGLTISLVIIVLMALFFKTEIGQALIATGDNMTMARSLGVDTDEAVMLGYMLANGLISLSGYLVATDNGYADISMGIGAVVIGLAAIIIGEAIFRNVSMTARLFTILVGSIIYRLLLMIVLKLNFDPNDFKLLSAVIIGIALAVPTFQQRRQNRRFSKKGVK